MTLHYVALGDSYTIGESVPESDRWPNQLAAALKAQGHPVEVTIIARTGWTTAELWRGIQAAQPQGTYDLVSLLIGVNNQYRGYDIEAYRDEFQFLLGKSIEYAGRGPSQVIALSIPDWGVTPFSAGQDRALIASEIDAFNRVNREESQRGGVHYVNVTPISRLAADDPELVAYDGLHPSAKMYAMWVELVLPVVMKIIKR